MSTQTKNFIRMHHALKTIAKGYQTPEQLRKNCGKYGLTYQESLQMAYENLQETARQAIKGVRLPKTKPLKHT